MGLAGKGLDHAHAGEIFLHGVVHAVEPLLPFVIGVKDAGDEQGHDAQDNDDEFTDSDVCYFYQAAELPGEGLSGSEALHRRWCNGNVNLEKRPELAGEFFKYLKESGL